MNKSFDLLIASLCDWISSRAQRTMVLVSGGGASGKSFLCDSLINRIGEDNVNYIQSDTYLTDSSIRNNSKWEKEIAGKVVEGRLTACCPDATFLPGINRDIQSMYKGVPVWTVEDNDCPSVLLSPARKICLVDGIGACFSDISLFDLSIFIYCSKNDEYQRRLIRDSDRRGVPIKMIKSDFELRRIQFDLEVFSRREEFDMVLKSKVDFSVEVEKDNLAIIK